MSSGTAVELMTLRAYGACVESLCQPSIAVGGFVVPGDAAAGRNLPVQEYRSGEGTEGPAAKAGSATGSWARPSAHTAAASQAAHAVGVVIDGKSGTREADELVALYPDARTAASSSNLDILTMRLGLFADLPFRARLFLEVPRFDLMMRLTRPIVIPEIRAWSFWDAGWNAGLPITSHHEYPDGSMCVCMGHDWIRGRDLLVDYVNFCVCWIANILHDNLIGFYPGPQHIPAYLRRRRDRPNEYCGCGKPRRYRACHRAEDLRAREPDLLTDRREDHRRYSAELAAQSRDRNPLRLIGRAVSPRVA